MTVKRYHSWDSEEDETGGYVDYDDYAALKAERDELNRQVVNLAVENQAFKSAINQFDNWPGIEFHSSAWEFNNCDGHEAGAVLNVESPATDAAIANIQAQGLESMLSIEPSELLEKMPAFRQMTVSEENVRDVLNSIRLTLKLRKGAAV